MSLRQRLLDLATAIGTDVKNLQAQIDDVVPLWTSPSEPPTHNHIWIDTDEPAPTSYEPPELIIAGVDPWPTTPYDGKEIYYVVDGTEPLWHFRYREIMHIVDGYGWEFLGGVPLRDAVDTLEALAGGSSASMDLATVGPLMTVPLSGIYHIAQTFNSTATGASNLLVNGAATGHYFAQGNGDVRGDQERTLVVGDALKMQYQRQTGSVSYRYRTILLTPVRVKS